MDIRTQRLNEAFNASGMTQTELCEKTGITKGALSSYLSGRYFPKQKAIEALANALNVPIAYLMGYGDLKVMGNVIIDFEDITLLDDIMAYKIRKLSEPKKKVLNNIIDLFLEEEEDGDKNTGKE